MCLWTLFNFGCFFMKEGSHGVRLTKMLAHPFTHPHTECVVWVEPARISVWVYNLRCGSRLIGSPKCPTQKCLRKWLRNACVNDSEMQSFIWSTCNFFASYVTVYVHLHLHSTESAINNGKSRNLFCQFVHYLACPRFVNLHFFCHALVVPPVFFCLYGFALDILECFPPFVIRSTG